MINTNKHIWEGWTIQDFINELEFTFEYRVFRYHFLINRL